MSGNPTWIWACWPYPVQESLWCRMGFIAYLTVGGLLFVSERTCFLQSLAFSGLCGVSNWTYNNHICGPYQQAHTTLRCQTCNHLSITHGGRLGKSKVQGWTFVDPKGNKILSIPWIVTKSRIFLSIIPSLDISLRARDLYTCSNYLR